MDSGFFEGLRGQYIDQLSNEGYGSADWESGGSGAAAGSILGVAVSVLEEIFKVKSTYDGHNSYLGAKKEGVYGNSNLVIYATLDPAAKLDPSLGKIWTLHLESDHGQISDVPNPDPVYKVPDLSEYADKFFFRVRNARYGTFLYAKDNDSDVGVRSADIPFNPLTMREYWSVSPIDAGDSTHNVKILNTATNKWLTCYTSDSNRIGLYPVGYTDYSDQHWNLNEVSQDPETVKIQNVANGGNLVGSDSDHTFIYGNIDSSDDQKWKVETLTVDIHKIPEGKNFRIMHAKTGMFMYCTPDNKIIGMSESSIISQFLSGMGYGPACFNVETDRNGKYKLKSNKYKSYLTFYDNNDGNYLGLYPDNAGDYSDQHWDIVIESHHAGFYLRNQGGSFGGSNYLYYKDNGFGVYNGTYDDQLWVAVLD